jgi:putative flippase GtrA
METIKKLIYKYKIFVKYCIVGGTAAVVDFGVLFILTELFLGVEYYLVSATISFVLSAFTNYFLNRSWTFRSNGKKRKQIPIFFAVATMGLFINNSIMFVGMEKFLLKNLHYGYLLAKVIATGLVLIWNFLGNKYITFNDKIKENEISNSS